MTTLTLVVPVFLLAIFAQLLHSSPASASVIPTPLAGNVPAEQQLESSSSLVLNYWRSLAHAQKVSLLALTLLLPRAHAVLVLGDTVHEQILGENLRARLAECSSAASSSLSPPSEEQVSLQAEKVKTLEEQVRAWPERVAEVRDAVGSALELLSTFLAPYVRPLSSTIVPPTAAIEISSTPAVSGAIECITAEPLKGAAFERVSGSASPLWLALAPVALCLLSVAALGGWGLYLRLLWRGRIEKRALRLLNPIATGLPQHDCIELLQATAPNVLDSGSNSRV